MDFPETHETLASTTVFFHEDLRPCNNTKNTHRMSSVGLPAGLGHRGVAPGAWAAFAKELGDLPGLGPTGAESCCPCCVACVGRFGGARRDWAVHADALCRRRRALFEPLGIQARAIERCAAPNGWAGPAILFSWAPGNDAAALSSSYDPASGTMAVAVPPGTPGGSTLQVAAPDGRVVDVHVPDPPPKELTVDLPPPTPPQVAAAPAAPPAAPAMARGAVADAT